VEFPTLVILLSEGIHGFQIFVF
jgi:hypothetical protein